MSSFLALDQGTTSSRALIFDRFGKVLGSAQKEFEQHFPQPGWVEHDATEIWATQIKVAQDAIHNSGLELNEISAIGIANQRETTVVWDRLSGEPVCPAIVWQDRRTSNRCEDLRNPKFEAMVRSKTGLTLDPYFCATKIEWILDHISGARSRAENGDLLFGTVDSWLLWKLTKGRVHATDTTNASRTLLWNLGEEKWDDELLKTFGIPSCMMPEVRPSSHLFGHSEASVFGMPIPIGGIAGDQQSALFGQGCTQPGLAKNTYGTGCFALMHIGSKPKHSLSRLLTTAACSNQGEKAYAFEGSVFCGGSAVQWLRDGLGIIKCAADVESLAATVDDTAGVYLVPAFTGLGAPHWDAYARGAILGITRGTKQAHIARATLEGIAFQVAEVLESMEKDTGQAIQQLRVDGGASDNNLLMQMQADLLQTPVVRSNMTEATAFGAAFLAGMTSGVWQETGEIDEIYQVDRIFEPQGSPQVISERRERWSEAVGRTLQWEK